MIDRDPPPLVRQRANIWDKNDPWMILVHKATLAYDNSILLLQYYIRRWLTNRELFTGKQA